jgi:ABC-type Fe3+ transport system permease subunit
MKNKRWWIIGLIIALAVTVLSPLASPWPDGLERVAENEGFMDRALEPVFQIVPDYVLPGVPNEDLATILAGIIGVLIVFGLAIGVGYALRRDRSERGPRQV